MDIPLNVAVYGRDGLVGRSTYAILNPISNMVTHMVVRDHTHHHVERLVPVDHIQDSDSDIIHLDCTAEQFAVMEPFEEVEYVPTTVPHYESPIVTGDAYAWPYITVREGTQLLEVVHRRIPPYERDVRRGAHVHATDGRIGQVDELVVDKDTFQLTHLVLSEGHLWGQKDVMIPVDEIDSIAEDNIYLKLDKRSVGALPTFPIRRHIQH